VLLLKKQGIIPGLSVILAGDDPASNVYVGMKEKACAEIGMKSEVYRLPGNSAQGEVEALVDKLNHDSSVHGILVQLPLPKNLNTEAILHRVNPDKDVDGLHPYNMGLLMRGEGNPFIPGTPYGIMHLIRSTGIEILGKDAVIVGRSNLVGKPLGILLLREHATVTWCHTRTQDRASHTRRADILVVAVGQKGIVQGADIKPGAVVIDVGTNKINGKLIGDVDFESAKEVAAWITPVPGGVGPMTVAMLMKNCVKAARKGIRIGNV
jgi:methylenetetrahydrofolate dehydrogenase (NADP+)/methenyltetrahydrofolate cyclohydrolase